MKTTKTPIPTRKELLILTVMWQLGPTTVRAVHDHLKQRQQTTTYTTTLKMMQVMLEKGLLKKNSEPVAHIYTPKISQETTQIQLIQDLISRGFYGQYEDLWQLLKKIKKSQ
ncbi:MAG: BlaI/MecI/CopY family transcriptional regulator [Proteobacteria bacterium]|nr:MAG: BlaI/MecI/CopY family transcriptional regulator [Pseudomonadota bacterium]